MKKMITALPFLLLLLALAACKEDDPPNPFDERVEVPGGPDTLNLELEPTSIEGLHARIFRPTCANSGCHDGTFEPNFRTIESTYNTLLFQPIIKNDLQGSYEYRVLPGQVDASQLVARLTFDIDGNSGVMPLVVEPDSDWEQTKAQHIEHIKTWIREGAKDVAGNPGVLNDNGRPGMRGVAARGNDWLPRSRNGRGAIEVSRALPSVELYFALSDDKISPAELGHRKVRFASDIDGFADQPELPLEVLSAAEFQEGFEGETVPYYHKVTIDPMDYASEVGQTVYFRVYVRDDANPITEIPADGGAPYIKHYFSFTLTQ
ncbi:MAG: hypothetical protein AAF146_15575 [Bacteroidota bacterium]